jgi:hypothetical protein
MPGGTQTTNQIWNLTDNYGYPVYSGLYSISVSNLAADASLTVQVEVN